MAATGQDERRAPNQVRRIFLEPGSQIVGVYGKLENDNNIAWFCFVLANSDWKLAGQNAIYR